MNLITRRTALAGIASAAATAGAGSAFELASRRSAPPTPQTPIQRAALAWIAFADAMDEVSIAFNGGWRILGAGHRLSYDGRAEQRWCHLIGSRVLVEPEPRTKAGFMYVEHHGDLDFAAAVIAGAWEASA